jgi:hypothetical protein
MTEKRHTLIKLPGNGFLRLAIIGQKRLIIAVSAAACAFCAIAVGACKTGIK